MEDIKSRIDEIEKVLYGDKTTGEKGLFFDYIFTKRILKFLGWLFGIINSIGLVLMGIVTKYAFDLFSQVIKNQTLIEQLLRQGK